MHPTLPGGDAYQLTESTAREQASQPPATPPIERLAAHGAARTLRPGDRLAWAGDRASHVFVVTAGMIARVQIDRDGSEWIIDVEGRGAVLGDGLCAQEERWNDHLVSVGRTNVVAVPLSAARSLLRRDAEVGLAVCQQSLASRARQATHQADLMGQPIDVRIVRQLLRVAELSERIGSRPLSVPVTRELLARAAGVSRQSVSEVLVEAQRAGWLRLGRGRIDVLDHDRLHQVVDAARTPLRTDVRLRRRRPTRVTTHAGAPS